MVEEIILVIYTALVFLLQYIYYLCGRDKGTCIFNVLKKMASINVLYIKVLQAFPSRDKLLTLEQEKELQRYTDNVPYTTEDIDDEFLCHFEKDGNQTLLLENNGFPIRSGCISLVYGGILDNNPVIVKVGRKNIKAKIESALKQLKYIVWLITLFNSKISVDINDFLNEHRQLFLKQIDFASELNNLQKMKHNFKNIDTVIIPSVYPDFTKKYSNMIVMDYIDGFTLNNIHDDDKDKYVEIIIKYFLKSWMYDRFYHGDFHPGNIIFVKNDICKIGVIDLGLMNTLTEFEQTGIHSFISIMSTSDNYYEGIRQFTEDIIRPKNTYDNLEKSVKEEILLRNSIIIKDAFSRSYLNASDLNIINGVLHDYKLNVDPRICKFILAITVLDSVVQRVSKDANYIDLIQRYAKSMFLTDLADLIEM